MSWRKPVVTGSSSSFETPLNPFLVSSTTLPMKNIAKVLIKKLISPRLWRWLQITRKRIRFFGVRCKCPLCKSFVRVLFPIGDDFPVIKEHDVVGGGYRHALCPVCYSLDRERLLFLYLSHKTTLFAGRYRVLHIAPEQQVKTVLSQKMNLDYLTADLLESDVMIKMDVTDIQFHDDSFDAIICNHVLEHIIDDRKALAELYRVLKPLGWAILQVPISLSLGATYEDTSITTEKGREEAFGQSDHVRIYAKDYKTRLAQAGFKVDIFDWTTERANFGGSRNLYGLDERERVYIGRKA
jgi:predicted SAM-dependent methyltransferase